MNGIFTSIAKALELAGMVSVPGSRIYEDVSVTPVVLQCSIPASAQAAASETECTEAPAINGQRIIKADGDSSPYNGAIRGLTVVPHAGTGIVELNRLLRNYDVVLHSGGIPVAIPVRCCVEGQGETGAAGFSGFDNEPGEPAFLLPAPLAWTNQSAGGENRVTLYSKASNTPATQIELDVVLWFGGARQNDAQDGRFLSETGYEFGDAAVQHATVAVEAIRAAREARARGKSVSECVAHAIGALDMAAIKNGSKRMR